MTSSSEDNTDISQKKNFQSGTQSEEELLNKRLKAITFEKYDLLKCLVELKEVLENYKNFNKTKCFSNIRELLRRNQDAKIGQIEKEAGVRLGYMSRLEKDGNTSEPSIEFIVSAGKILNVSLDTLISIDIAELTPTEQYIIDFFDKLKSDTLADKLEWKVETPGYLNSLEPETDPEYGYEYVDHPLFAPQHFYEDADEQPRYVDRIVFNSHSFGLNTIICGDCFNLRMKNGTRLFLMDIRKTGRVVNDSNEFAKEIWSSTPNVGLQFFASNRDNNPIAPLVDTLFSVIKERMKHPKLNKEVMNAIDAFMKDDLSDDDFNNADFDTDEFEPFN